MGKSLSKGRPNKIEPDQHNGKQCPSVHLSAEQQPSDLVMVQKPHTVLSSESTESTLLNVPLDTRNKEPPKDVLGSGDNPGLSNNIKEVPLLPKKSHSSPLILFLPESDPIFDSYNNTEELDTNQNPIPFKKGSGKIPVPLAVKPSQRIEIEDIKGDTEQDIEYILMPQGNKVPPTSALSMNSSHSQEDNVQPTKAIRTATYTAVSPILGCPNDININSNQMKCQNNTTASSNSTISSKKKLVVRGLKNFVKSRGSHPPRWLRDFPCKSKFDCDTYLYDFEEGPNAPKRPVGAMQNCPKKSGKCVDCGIYADETCRCCRKCPLDCACPKPPAKVPDVMNQAFGPGWSQAQKVILEMTQDERRSPVGGSSAKGVRQFNQSGDSQPPHLKCHIDVLNPYKLPCDGEPDPVFLNESPGYNPGYNFMPAGVGHPNSYYPMLPPQGFCYYPPPPPPMFPSFYGPPPMPTYMHMPMPMPMQMPPPPPPSYQSQSQQQPQQQYYANQNYSSIPPHPQY